jgi:hypothetical protein
MKKSTILFGLGSAYLLYKVNQMGYFQTKQEVPKTQKQKGTSFKTMFLIYFIGFCFVYLPKIINYLKDKYGEGCMSCTFSTCFQCDIGEKPEDTLNTKDTNTNNVSKVSKTFITKDVEDIGDTKDIKISSESLGSGNVVVYKIVTDKELDNNFLNFEDDDTPNITINKITKPINENNENKNKNKKRKLNKRKVEIIIDKTKNKDNQKYKNDTENINNNNESIEGELKGVKADCDADTETE